MQKPLISVTVRQPLPSSKKSNVLLVTTKSY